MSDYEPPAAEAAWLQERVDSWAPIQTDIQQTREQADQIRAELTGGQS